MFLSLFSSLLLIRTQWDRMRSPAITNKVLNPHLERDLQLHMDAKEQQGEVVCPIIDKGIHVHLQITLRLRVEHYVNDCVTSRSNLYVT